MNVIPEGSQTLKAFWISLCGVFIATSLLGLNLGSVLAYASTRTEKLTNKLQVSMSNIGGSWKTRSHTLKVISEAEQLMTRDHRVPASWFYTWYAILWTFFIFPAQELGSAGGIIHLVNKTSPGSKRGLSASGGWFWGAAVVPLRILLLPVHVVFLLLDYILLVIFSVSIVGRDISTGKESTEDHASTSRLLDSGKKGDKEPEVHESDALVDKPASPTPVPAWKSRFTAPITTLQEFSKFGSGLAAKASEPPKIEVQVDPSIVYPAPDSSTVPLLHIQTNTEGIESSPSQKEPGSPVYKALQHALENAKARNAKILAKTNDEDSDTESSCDPESSDSDSDDDEAGEAGGKTKDNADAGDSGSKTEDDGDDGSGSGSSTEDDDDGDDGSGTEDEDSHHKGPNSASLTTPLKATPYRLSTVVASRPPIIEEPQSIREGSGGSISELMGGIIRGKRSEERDLEKGT